MGNNKSSREIEIILPVTVVDHDAKVAENPWAFQPYPDRPLRDKLETILLIPLIPFVLIYFEIACLGNACKWVLWSGPARALCHQHESTLDTLPLAL